MLIICIATIIFLVGQRRNTETNTAALPEKISQGSTVRKNVKSEVLQPSVVQGHSIDPLTNANQCVHYILGLADGLPQKNGTARLQMHGLAVALFINDYVMAVHNDQSLKLSAADISAAFTNAISPALTNGLEDMQKLLASDLQFYNRFQETLPEHYERIKQNSSASNGVQQVIGTLTASGIAVDSQSDMLLDCLRMLCMKTTAEQFYGESYSIQMQDLQSLASPSFAVTPEEIFWRSKNSETSVCSLSYGGVLQWRLIHRYGIDERTAVTLVKNLWGLSVNGFSEFSSADLQVPAGIQ